MEQQNNPLKTAILQILQQQQEPLAIHQLLHHLKQKIDIPQLDKNQQLALFKLNWLMMNALYQLQWDCYFQGYYLHISTLKIYLQAITQQSNTSNEQAIKNQALRDYYLDWKNFSETTIEQVKALLDGVWLTLHSSEQIDNAYHTLGLKQHADKVAIRKQFRLLASRNHPDKGGDAATFMQIREAYEVLMAVAN